MRFEDEIDYWLKEEDEKDDLISRLLLEEKYKGERWVIM